MSFQLKPTKPEACDPKSIECTTSPAVLEKTIFVALEALGRSNTP